MTWREGAIVRDTGGSDPAVDLAVPESSLPALRPMTLLSDAFGNCSLENYLSHKPTSGLFPDPLKRHFFSILGPSVSNSQFQATSNGGCSLRLPRGRAPAEGGIQFAPNACDLEPGSVGTYSHSQREMSGSLAPAL